jgi:hypothetical protein
MAIVYPDPDVTAHLQARRWHGSNVSFEQNVMRR